MNQAWLASGQLLHGILSINAQMCWPATPERPLEREKFFRDSQEVTRPGGNDPSPALGSIRRPGTSLSTNALFLTISRQVEGFLGALVASIGPRSELLRPENEVVFRGEY